MKIVIVEGTPGAGKNTAAEVIATCGMNGPWVVDELWTEVRERCHGALKLFTRKGSILPAKAFEGEMDKQFPYFDRLSPRTAYNQFLENYVYKCHGRAAPARWLIQRIEHFMELQKKQLAPENRARRIVIADAINEECVGVLTSRFGAENTVVMEVLRPGCFEHRKRVGARFSIFNKGTIDDMAVEIKDKLPEHFIEVPPEEVVTL